MAAGYQYACAVVSGGVQCWGTDGNGELGNGGTSQSNVPVHVLAPGEASGSSNFLTGAATGASGQLAAGTFDACVRKTTGAVNCWGYNNAYGELGAGVSTAAGGTASQLVFTTQPGGGTSGTAWSTQPVVAVEDALGNVVNTNTSSVSLAITAGTGAAGASLTCTANPKAAVSGIATFAGCNIDKVGTGYTLTATDGALTSTISSTFNVAAGAANKLVFSTQPNGATAGNAFSTQPTVSVEDAAGNVVTGDASPVALAITGGTGTAGAALTCTANPQTASTGVATFSGCSIDKPGKAYTLTATDGALTSATSAAFNNVGPATQLAFTTQPVGGVAEGTSLPTQPTVSVEDSAGNVVTTDSSSVTLSIASGPASGSLICTANPQAASAGLATFAGCKITGTAAAGTYTLNAADGGLTAATSSSFVITVGPAAKLAFTMQPSGGTSGVAWSTQPVVNVLDASGNLVTTDSSPVTLAITGGTGSPGAALTCSSNPQAASSGVATFAGCQIDKAGNGYTLTATDSALTAATSAAFNITAGAANKLVFTTQPVGGVTEGASFSTQPAVSVEDSAGNVIASDSSSVTLAIHSGPAGGTLTCDVNPQTASSGVATFSGCQITGTAAAGTYTLTATDGGLTAATSASFVINPGVPTQLVFTTQPSGGTGGVAWSTQPAVSVEDVNSNVVTSDTSSVALAITSGTGDPSATLTCAANPQAAVAGVATFSGCKIDKPGNGYTLTATDGSLTSAVSAAFNVTVGSASQVVFTTQPVGGVTEGTSLPTQPVVSVEDAGGNVVTTDSSSVTLSKNSGPAGGTLSCSSGLTAAASSGVATFSGCQITGTAAAGTYTLHAADGSLTAANSASFVIVPGAATQVAFTTQPVGGVTEGTTLPTQPAVSVEDANGNVVTSDSSSVTLSINSGPASGTLTCSSTLTVAASSGVATFAGCKITGNAAAGSYTLNAAARRAHRRQQRLVRHQPRSGEPGRVHHSARRRGDRGDGSAHPAGGERRGRQRQRDHERLLIGDAHDRLRAGERHAHLHREPQGRRLGRGDVRRLQDHRQRSGRDLHPARGRRKPHRRQQLAVRHHCRLGQPGGVHHPARRRGDRGDQFLHPAGGQRGGANGNVVTTDSSSVMLTINSYTGPGSSGTLTCAVNPQAAASGVATFSGCQITGAAAAGTYTLHAADGALTAANSATFVVNPSGAHPARVHHPADHDPGGQRHHAGRGGLRRGRPGQRRDRRQHRGDRLDHRGHRHEPFGGTLSGTLTQTAAGGQATFANLSIQKTGNGYTLTAHDSTRAHRRPVRLGRLQRHPGRPLQARVHHAADHDRRRCLHHARRRGLRRGRPRQRREQRHGVDRLDHGRHRHEPGHRDPVGHAHPAVGRGGHLCGPVDQQGGRGLHAHRS